MKKLLFILLLAITTLSAEEPQRVCLNMIVKNEKAVIRRCLESVKPFIHYWVIVDTGSTDGTQEIIKEYMKDIPGELHERPWVDFAHNRNEAMDLAKTKGDYLLFIDADDVLKADADFRMPKLTKDAYYIFIQYGDTEYARPQIVSTKINWRWEGVLHEALHYPGAKTIETLHGIKNVVHTDGARSQDPEKYKKDAKILEAAVKKDPYNSRHVFYLAQSYRDAGEHEKALEWYQKRVAMGGWEEEVYWSMVQIAALHQNLNHPINTILKSYYDAYIFRPSRPEALYMLTRLYREHEMYQAGYEAAKKMFAMPRTQDVLMVKHWMHDYGTLLEYSVCAYWLGHYEEALIASQLLLKNPELPVNFRECVIQNLGFIHQKLAENKTQLTLKEVASEASALR